MTEINFKQKNILTAIVLLISSLILVNCINPEEKDTIDIIEEIECKCIEEEYENFKDFIPIPWNNVKWVVEFGDPYGDYHILEYTCVKDTFMYGNCYTELLKDNKLFRTHDTIHSVETIAWFRQDIENKKVYYRHAYWPNEEKLLYDFNLGIGDTIPNSYLNFIISHVDSILINNRYHTIYTSNGSIYIIEGVGTAKGILGLDGFFERLTGFYINGEKLFPLKSQEPWVWF